MIPMAIRQSLLPPVVLLLLLEDYHYFQKQLLVVATNHRVDAAAVVYYCLPVMHFPTLESHTVLDSYTAAVPVVTLDYYCIDLLMGMAAVYYSVHKATVLTTSYPLEKIDTELFVVQTPLQDDTVVPALLSLVIP